MHRLNQFKRDIELRHPSIPSNMSMPQFLAWCVHQQLLKQGSATILADLYEQVFYQSKIINPEQYSVFSNELEQALSKKLPTKKTLLDQVTTQGKKPRKKLIIGVTVLVVSLLLLIFQNSGATKVLLDKLFNSSTQTKPVVVVKRVDLTPAGTQSPINHVLQGSQPKLIDASEEVSLTKSSRIVFDTRLKSSAPAKIFIVLQTQFGRWVSPSTPVNNKTWTLGHAIDIPESAFTRLSGQSDLAAERLSAKLQFGVVANSGSSEIKILQVRATVSKVFSTAINLPYTGTQGRGVSFADIDRDGDVDLFLANNGNSMLWKNQHANFEKNIAPEISLVGRLRTGQWADYDNDGDQDLLVTGSQMRPQLWRNKQGNLSKWSSALDIDGPFNLEGASWLDYNLDGEPDLLITNGEHGVALFQQQQGAFKNISRQVGFGPMGLGSVNGDFLLVHDMDGDSYTDIIYNAERGIVLKNSKGKAFSEAGWGINFTTLGSSQKLGLSLADVDNDGDFDIYVPQPDRSLLYINNGLGGYTLADADKIGDAAHPARSSTWEDLDKDGDVDLVIALAKGPMKAFRNTMGSFEDFSVTSGVELFPAGEYARGIMFADFDNDGDGDLAISGDKGRAGVLVNSQKSKQGFHSFTLRFNKVPLPGTVVRVRLKGTDQVQSRILGAPENIGSQTPYEARFSVKENTPVEVEVSEPSKAKACYRLGGKLLEAKIIMLERLKNIRQCSI